MFRSLLARVTEIARDAQLADLRIWVLEDNLLASRAYARVGFEFTGQRTPFDPGHDRFERRMRLAI